MNKYLVAILALAFGTATVAHADLIYGSFDATGNDSFTTTSSPNTITFTPNGPSGTPGNSIVSGSVNGSFATYLSAGDLLTFLSGPLPFMNGLNTPPNPPYTSGYVPNFFTVTGTSASGTETYGFNLSSYTASIITNGTDGCASGATCLVATGDGFFNGYAGTSASGTPNGTSGNAAFTFTSQYDAEQTIGSNTTFSASVGAPLVPEPASLALVGTGLIGLVGLFRRKLFA